MTKNLGDFFINGEDGIVDIVGGRPLTITNVITMDGSPIDGKFLAFWPGYKITTPLDSFLSFYGDFTIDFWIKNRSSYPYCTPMTTAVNGNAVGGWWLMFGTSSFGFYYDIYGANPISFSSTALNNAFIGRGEWFHFALVRHNGVITAYKNGVAIDSITHSGNIVSSNQLSIGILASDTNTYFEGYLDNIRIANEALWNDTFDPYDSIVMRYTGVFPISSIYSIGHRGNLRGKAKQGWVRPTIKQFFTSADWEEVFNGYRAKSVVFDINSRYGGTNYGIRTIGFYNKENQIELVDNYTAYQSSTFNSSSYLASFVFNSNSTKIGQAYNNGWASVQTTNPQRLIVVFDDIITFNKMIVNNYHHIGSLSEIGLKNVKITITTATITSTAPNTSVQNGIVIFDDVFEKHTSINEVQDWEVPLV